MNLTRVGLLALALGCLSACSYSEMFQRAMTWSTRSDAAELSELPPGAVRLTFSDAPKFHVQLQLPDIKKHLEAVQKPQVTVEFEIHCKHRQFALIRVRSVDGVPVRTGPDNMIMETGNVLPGKDPGPFPGACSF